ncbi:very short patch repair endonuclease [Aeromicrobium sp. 179-A 4D2 NHS]|uniref:very short patch repair endonuclease n=1 Tax=Aeromicrobium sp. 179-A 4D2 NHS TaxID=3142375 RepID=UPI0039A3C7DC
MPKPANEHVRRRFAAQRTRDTTAEIQLRRELHRMGYRYRVDTVAEPSIRSKPDIVFRRKKVAVYVDGCFWHGCPEHFIPPKNNAAWWDEKISANRHRDASTRARLVEHGWRVLAFWEHEDVLVAANVVATALRSDPPVGQDDES